MPTIGPNRERHVVPRWRGPQQTIELGELSSLTISRSSPLSSDVAEHFRSLRTAWRYAKDQERLSEARSIAAEVLGLALTADLPMALDEEVALLLDESAPTTPVVRRLALSFRSRRDQQEPALALRLPPTQAEPERTRELIAHLKAGVRSSPRDVLAWVELSRQYAILAQHNHAQAAMRIAQQLSPQNRYVLRSAARLHVVADDPASAHKLIARSDAVHKDPWLMASELALAAEADRPPISTRRARRLIDRGEVPPFHLSELASELATAELGAGNSRKARKLFRVALLEPHENGLAQVEWAAPQLPQLEIDVTALDIPHSFEARAREAAQRQDWEVALGEARYWLSDEQFSVSAAAFSSYVAGVVLEDFTAAEELAKLGIVSNPHSALLRNNLAFALAQQGRLAEASAELESVSGESQTNVDKVVLAATAGLIAYRSGDAAQGRDLYDHAIQRARQERLDGPAAVASFYLAREEVAVGSPHAADLVRRAIELVRHQSAPEYKVIANKLATLLDTIGS